jgi:hypothetical protein
MSTAKPINKIPSAGKKENIKYRKRVSTKVRPRRNRTPHAAKSSVGVTSEQAAKEQSRRPAQDSFAAWAKTATRRS